MIQGDKTMTTKTKIILTDEERMLLEGTIRAIYLDMESTEFPTYFDDENPDYDKDDKDWETADWDKRNGNKVIKILRGILDSEKGE
jgi:hypothetical protein